MPLDADIEVERQKRLENLKVRLAKNARGGAC